MFDIRQREEEKEKLWKTKTLNCNNSIFCLCHVACRCTRSNMFKFCSQPFENYSRHFTPHLLFMDKNVTYRNNSINSLNNNVVWRHVYLTMINTDDSTCDLTSYSEPIQYFLHSDWLPSERHLEYIADDFCRLGRALLQLRSDVRRYVKSLQLFSSRNGLNLWAVKLSRIMFSVFFSFLTFLLVFFTFQIYINFLSDVK